MELASGLLLGLGGYLLIITVLHFLFPESHLDWSRVNLENIAMPEGFVWGVATASHQIEGDNTNNWTQFEQREGKEQSGKACDHWNLWAKDHELLSELGVNSYRFSIEWSRIEPVQGEWNEAAIKVYSQMIDSLIAKGIEPMITLHHFSHPVWFEELGGFYNRENIVHFQIYCKKLFPYFSSRVRKWCTVSEPDVFSIMGYHMGMFPPGQRSPIKAIRVMKNVMIAHGEVYHELKQMSPESYIGLAKNVTIFDPYRRWNLLHWLTSFALNYIWNGAIISALKKGRMYGVSVKQVKNSADFIGLNYYTHVLTSPFLPQTTEIDLPSRNHETVTEFGYPMYAEGLDRASKWLVKLNLPIEITENGVADKEDNLRPEHLKRHLWMIAKLIQEGIDIKSYYHWSLMDNFEWAEGYTMRFGLYHVDYETQTRTLRASGKAYQSIIKQHQK